MGKAVESVGRIEFVDPKTLLVGANVRTEVKLTKEFLSSVKEHGVLVPIIAHESSEGLVVEEGQRRTLAAVDAGATSVPVYVRSEWAGADRIIGQVVANEFRSDLNESEAIAAVQELALFDMKAPAIAKKIGLPRKFIDQAVAVGASKVAQEAMRERQLSFDTAVLLAEFDEFPKEQKQLLKLDGDWQIKEKAREFRKARLVAAIEAEIKAAEGVTLIKDPGYSSSDPLPLRRVYVDAKRQESLDGLPHERVVELAGDGLCAYASMEWNEGDYIAVVRYAVKGWKARGLFAYDSGEYVSKPTTPAEIEKAKQERRQARENTKAWVAASVGRIGFLQGLVKRKTMPKGWEPLVVARLLDNNSHVANEWRMTIVMLGLKESADKYSLRGVVEAHLKKSPSTALQTALATYLGSVEGGFEFDRKGWADPRTPAYLRQLSAWGYELSEPEQAVANKKGKAAA